MIKYSHASEINAGFDSKLGFYNGSHKRVGRGHSCDGLPGEAALLGWLQ